MKRSLTVMAAAIFALATTAYAANSLTVVQPGINSTGSALQVNLDDTSTTVYVETQEPSGETHYKIRFWVDPTDLANLAPNTSLRIGAVNSTTFGQRLVFFLRHDAPGTAPQFQVNAWGLQDTGEPANYTFLRGVNVGPVSGAVPNQVEIEWTRSSGAAQADGVFRIQRITPGNTGVNQQLSNLTMYNFTVDDARFGVLAGSGTNMLGAGSFKFDEFESYR